MQISRRAWVLGSAGTLVAGIGAMMAPARASAKLSPVLLQDDMVWLSDTMLEIGADPFATSDRTAWIAQRDATIAAIKHPMTIWEYWLQSAGPLFAALNDGHAFVSPYFDFKAARANGVKAFPLVVTIRGDQMYVSDQTLDAVPSGTRILRIDGQPVSGVIAALARLRGGQTPALRRVFSEGTLSMYLYARDGERADFELALQPAGTKSVITTVVSATTRSMLLDGMKRFAGPAKDNYSFTRIGGGRVGYIDYSSCEDLDAFEKFLRSTFSAVQGSPIDGLVVDIRENGGGDSALNDQLWQWVSNKPFSQYGGGEERISDRLKHEYGEKKFIEIYGDRGWSAADGALLTWDANQLIEPKPNPLRYAGPVYLLIGTGTFSSAMSCAVAAKDFGLATIVGEETGEPVNSTGEVYFGPSPKSGIAYQFTTKFFRGPKPRPNAQGVVPDVTIVRTQEDLQTHRDPVLEYAVRQITKSSR